ncbi:hypothetical protein HDU93_001286 [Gonapodya sp. JEL0774]|nr:hypothetical protein HDU93_001286 [Gonapodya sp. JEL0774]
MAIDKTVIPPSEYHDADSGSDSEQSSSSSTHEALQSSSSQQTVEALSETVGQDLVPVRPSVPGANAEDVASTGNEIICGFPAPAAQEEVTVSEPATPPPKVKKGRTEKSAGQSFSGSPQTPVYDVDDLANTLSNVSLSRSSFHRSKYDGSPIRVGHGFSPDGKKYESLGGNVYDTSDAPPGLCFNCGVRHWRKDCPWGRRY